MIDVMTVLGVLALALALALLGRDQDELARVWHRLVSPQSEGLRRNLELQLETQDQLARSRRAMAAEATRSGTPLEAGRLAELEREARAQHRALVILRRMLSAVRSR